MRILDEINASGIHMVVGNTNLWKLGRHRIERALPQVAGKREHVRFVHQRHMFAFTLCCQFECITNATLDSEPCVHTALRGNLVHGSFAQYSTFAGVRAFGVFANHHKAVRLGMPWCGAGKWSLIDVQIQTETQLQQQAPFDYTWWHSRCAHGTEQNHIKVA